MGGVAQLHYAHRHDFTFVYNDALTLKVREKGSGMTKHRSTDEQIARDINRAIEMTLKGKKPARVLCVQNPPFNVKHRSTAQVMNHMEEHVHQAHTDRYRTPITWPEKLLLVLSLLMLVLSAGATIAYLVYILLVLFA